MAILLTVFHFLHTCMFINRRAIDMIDNKSQDLKVQSYVEFIYFYTKLK